MAAKCSWLLERYLVGDCSTINLQPTLIGSTLLLRPLQAADFAALHLATADPMIWEQHPEPTRYQAEVFRRFFDGGLQSKSAFLVIDKRSGSVIGSSRYYEWNQSAREIAIGYTFLVRSHWGGSCNREMKQLMLEHIFQWAATVWFHIGAQNWRSRKALEKLGGVLSHCGPLAVGGVAVEYAYYKIEAKAWQTAQRVDAPVAT